MKQATLTAVIWKEPTGYVSKYPELGVASCGDTSEEALDMLKEAVDLYLQNTKDTPIWDSIQEIVDSTEKVSLPLEVALP